MSKGKCVTLGLVKGSEREYIVKDVNSITLGRIFIVELDKENKYCLFRLNFYKEGEESYYYVVDTLELMLSILFKNMQLEKANVLVDEGILIDAFMDVGFELEGFLRNNKNKSKNPTSELLFGITKEDYTEGYIKLPITLRGRKIDLKILMPEDAEAMLEYSLRNKKHLEPFEPKRTDEYYTLEDQRKSLMESYKQFLNGKGINFGIFREDELIGKVRISNIIMGVCKSATIGYSIDEKEQGKGYMKEAVKIAIEYAFEELLLHRIEASTLVDNEKSQRVLKSCGFKELGLSEKYLYINGEWRDHLIFYKVKE